MMKRHWAMPTPQYKSKPTIASPIPRNTRQSWQTVTTVGCIYSWTRKAKRHVLGCQKWLVLPPNIWSLTAVKPTCCAIGNLMFLISALPLIFHFSHLLGIYLAQKQHTCLQKLLLHWKIVAKNILLNEKQSSRQQPPIPNVECLAAKHVIFAPN